MKEFLVNYDTDAVAQAYQKNHTTEEWSRIKGDYEKDTKKLVIFAICAALVLGGLLIFCVLGLMSAKSDQFAYFCIYLGIGVILIGSVAIAFIAVAMKNGKFGCKGFEELEKYRRSFNKNN